MKKLLLSFSVAALAVPAVNAAISSASDLSGTYVANVVSFTSSSIVEHPEAGFEVTVDVSGNTVYFNGLFPEVGDDELVGTYQEDSNTIVVKSDYYIGDYKGRDAWSLFYDTNTGDYPDDITLTITDEGNIQFPAGVSIYIVTYDDADVNIEQWVYGYQSVELISDSAEDGTFELAGTYKANMTVLSGYLEKPESGFNVQIETSGSTVYLNGLFPAVTDDELVGTYNEEAKTITINGDYYVGDYNGQDVWSYFYGSDYEESITLTITEKGVIEFPANLLVCAVIYDDVTVSGWVYGYKNVELVPQSGAGVKELSSSDNETVEYYTLQGLRINEPVKGSIVIRKQGNKTTKILVR